MARKNSRNAYTRRNQAATPTSLAGLWLLLGILLGVGIMGLAYIFYNPTYSQNFKIAQTNKHIPQTQEVTAAEAKQPRERRKVGSRKQNNNNTAESDQRFEFYTLLPGMEVELSDAPQTSNTQTKTSNIDKIKTPEKLPVQTTKAATSSSSTVEPKAKSTPTNRVLAKPLQLHSNAMATSSLTSKNNQNASSIQKTTAIQTTSDSNRTDTDNVSAKMKAAHYIVQAGIFQGVKEADALKARLTLQGFTPQIQKVQTQDGHAWFRVTLGPFASESSAVKQQKRLEDQKVRGILILQKPTE